jgi:hypothetical protein
MVDVPGATGWKLVASLESPGLNTTGLVVIVPTLVAELVTGTLTVPIPGLTSKPKLTTVSVPGSRLTG